MHFNIHFNSLALCYFVSEETSSVLIFSYSTLYSPRHTAQVTNHHLLRTLTKNKISLHYHHHSFIFQPNLCLTKARETNIPLNRGDWDCFTLTARTNNNRHSRDIHILIVLPCNRQPPPASTTSSLSLAIFPCVSMTMLRNLHGNVFNVGTGR